MGPGAAVTHQHEGRKKQGGHCDLSSSFGALPDARRAVGLAPASAPPALSFAWFAARTRCHRSHALSLRFPFLSGRPPVAPIIANLPAAFHAFGAPAILSVGRSVRFRLPLGPRTPGRRSDNPKSCPDLPPSPFYSGEGR
ncbi:hypothetical protein NDU88_002893 [Pleurodeles waltl]|uniref:Uncharacterized protein n=1 Tax=Pleurodeles waltl TaxID=8319 RepID=A0AAV7SFJ8_PLEWA|nr:hypothetical protein NDU88_002893 [Pleurodeles waltl]